MAAALADLEVWDWLCLVFSWAVVVVTEALLSAVGLCSFAEMWAEEVVFLIEPFARVRERCFRGVEVWVLIFWAAKFATLILIWGPSVAEEYEQCCSCRNGPPCAEQRMNSD